MAGGEDMEQRENLDGWIAKSEVVQLTGISERSLERRIQTRKLRVGYRTVPGRRPLPVIHPDDVDVLRAEMVQRTTEDTALPGKKELAIPVQPNATDLGQALVHALSQNQKEWPPFLSVKQAAESSGLSQSYLRRTSADGRLPRWSGKEMISLSPPPLRTARTRSGHRRAQEAKAGTPKGTGNS